MTDFGVYLKERRKKANFRTQEHLASYTLISQALISRAEASKIRPNDETLMILAIALNLDYREIFTRSKPRTDEDFGIILEQEKIDKKLFESVASIFTYLLKNDDSKRQTRFLNGPLKLINGEILNGVRYRLEKAQEHLRDTPSVKEETYIYIARREATRMFYSNPVRYASGRKVLVDFGYGTDRELLQPHPAIVIGDFKELLVVVPTNSDD
ncbi:helix-turn-helix domain-containing protein [Paenibacillus sp. 1781tsa1]|uniref:helix-turn-helix domain-containing protein n=1 Tax=Paenibacillus sp. 1781tsa1 TaxID=2953810 RepID=UPI0020A09AEF|nr:helix-turn-helix transcriptional regulator [Paenibacillus sp. 1781tsa1]MCP1186495.1 helix-turn-helix transcriptional regulator [Paenibacillus sp. 1781tsa1]